MINLIPLPAKSSITREYWSRVASVWLFILSGVAIIITALLVPVYVLVKGQIDVYATSAEEALSETAKFDLSSATLVQASKQATMILSLKEATRYTDLVELLSDLETEEVTIDNYNFSKEADGKIKPIAISGTAKTRQSLANFREALLNHEAIEAVNLPISNLALDRDIQFNVTVTLKEL